MTWDTNADNDYATGLDVLDREDLMERAEFWSTHNSHGLEAVLTFTGGDDFELYVMQEATTDIVGQDVVARFDNDFEAFDDWMSLLDRLDPAEAAEQILIHRDRKLVMA